MPNSISAILGRRTARPSASSGFIDGVVNHEVIRISTEGRRRDVVFVPFEYVLSSSGRERAIVAKLGKIARENPSVMTWLGNVVEQLSKPKKLRKITHNQDIAAWVIAETDRQEVDISSPDFEAGVQGMLTFESNVSVFDVEGGEIADNLVAASYWAGTWPDSPPNDVVALSIEVVASKVLVVPPRLIVPIGAVHPDDWSTPPHPCNAYTGVGNQWDGVNTRQPNLQLFDGFGTRYYSTTKLYVPKPVGPPIVDAPIEIISFGGSKIKVIPI